MSIVFHSSSSRAQAAAKTPRHTAFTRAAALLAVVFVSLLSFAACSSTKKVGTLTSIAVTPATASIAVGGMQQFTATGTFSDGSTQNLTSSTVWASSSTATATISASGLATALAVGTTTITATSGTIAGTATLTVTAPATLTSIAVTPATASIAVGATQAFIATGTFSDNSTKVLTTETWTSSNTATATIDTTGLATGVAAGTTTITATCGLITGTATLTVTAPATLTSIAVTAPTLSIAVGATDQFTATGTFSDGSMKVLTTETWTSGTPVTATISTTGLATGVAAGTTVITATCGSITGTATLTVTAAPTLVSIAVTPATASIAVAGTQQFTATGTFSDGSTQVLTNETWTSSDSTIATVSTTGLATGVAAGTATITATCTAITGTATLTVTTTTGSNALLNGQYALVLGGTDAFGATYSFAASITADGNGTITTAEIDFSDAAQVTGTDTFTGTYSIGSDGRGTITLNTNDLNFGVQPGGVVTLGVSVTGSQHGLIVEEDSFATGSGSLDAQDANSFSATNITGPYAFAFAGVDVVNTGFSQNVSGVFTADGVSAFNNGIQDVVTGSATNLDGSISGTFTGPDLNGRGTATFNGTPYAYYSVGGTTLNFIESDGVNQLAGSAFTGSTASLANGTYAFTTGGSDFNFNPLAVGGLFTSDGTATLTAGTLDVNEGNVGFSTGALITGSFVAPTSGRGTITISGGNTFSMLAFYPTANNGVLLLEIDGNNQSSGSAFLQSGTFAATSLTGPYSINFTGVDLTVGGAEQDLVGEVGADGAGNLNGFADLNISQVLGTGGLFQGLTFTGTYTADPSGRFAGTLTDSVSSQSVEFYVVGGSNPNTALFISADLNQVNSGVMEAQASGLSLHAGHSARVSSSARVPAPRRPRPASPRQGPRVPVK